MTPDHPNQIGPYRVDREIGRGGMGVVYFGHDSRLNRDVAIKSLPEHLAADPDRLTRFEREARTLASLSHPNIAGLYGVEVLDGARYLILEYVEGETLADRIDRGAIPLDEALDYAAQIASGIEAAHDAGVIHRDLKPQNVKITPEGKVKILDFGLARAEEAQSTTGMSSEVPTITTPVMNSPTIPGAIMGTAPYMSPEQARGRRVDRRTDIWSFGVMLYEMLTGIGPFHGETATDSIGAILHKDIDLSLLPSNAPHALRRVLGRCIERNKDQRYRDIGDVRIELESLDDDSGAIDVVPSGTPRLALLALLLILLLVSGVGWLLSAMSTEAPPAVVQPQKSLELSIALPAGLEVYGPIAISPDGNTVAFAGVSADDGDRHLYLRDLAGSGLRQVEGSRFAEHPFFAPDSLSVGFYAEDRIMRVPVDGGNPVWIVDASDIVGASWDDDGHIIYSEGVGSSLWRVPDSGGVREPLLSLEDEPLAYAHVWPRPIPGASKILLTTWRGGNSGGARIYDTQTGDLKTLQGTRVNDLGSERDYASPARWSASGHLILERWTSGLQAIAFDPDSEAPAQQSDARQLLDDVYYLQNSTHSVFSLSAEGMLAFVPGVPGRRSLVWVDPDGGVEPILEQDEIDAYSRLGGSLSLSPDGRSVLVGGGGDIVEIELDRKLPRRITFGDGNDIRPYWTDGSARVFYNSNRDTRWSVWAASTSGAGEPELILQTEQNIFLTSVGPSGELLLEVRSDGRLRDVMLHEPGQEPHLLVSSQFDEFQGAFSNDRQWIAYVSNVTGRNEVYVINKDGGAPMQVSVGGGMAPKWGPTGTTLYYRKGRGVHRFMLGEDGRPTGEPEAVFNAPNLLTEANYDFTPDESRMLAVQLDDEAIPDEIRIITTFFDRIEAVAGPGSR